VNESYALGVLRVVCGMALVAAAGCGGRHMALPEGLDDGMDKLTTDGRRGDDTDGVDDPIDLGPYQIEGVHRGLSESKGFEMFSEFQAAEKSGYSYRLTGSKKKLSGKCAARAPQKSTDVDGSVTVKHQLGLACSCELEGKSVAHAFVEDLGGEYGGPLVVGPVEAKLTGIYGLSNGDKLKGSPAGYRVDDEAGAVAAVDVLSKEGRFWIKRGLEEPGRSRLVCTLVGVMLWLPDKSEKK
jgi:hypothetical protein